MRIYATMFRFLSLAAALFAAVCHCSAQQTSGVVFDHAFHDFGPLKEEDGKVSHVFTFRNEGSEPVVVVSAETSCGCTAPIFTRRPVLSGQTGEIEVVYDPANRPGAFDKSITVVISGVPSPIVLHIAGNVLPRPRSLNETYPVYIGNGLRAEDNFHSFSYIEHGKTVQTSIGLVNTSGRRISLAIAPRTPNALLIAGCPKSLAAGERGELRIAYAPPSRCGRYGTISDVLEFTVDGRRSDASVTVTGIIIDNRDDIDDICRPKAEMSRAVIKFGPVRHAEHSRSAWLELLNSGAYPLHIRAVEYGADGTEMSLRAGDCLSAGERRRVEVRINPSRKDLGPTVERVRIITDDPDRPMRDLKLTMIVEND